jgi:hypothetical protein
MPIGANDYYKSIEALAHQHASHDTLDTVAASMWTSLWCLVAWTASSKLAVQLARVPTAGLSTKSAARLSLPSADLCVTHCRRMGHVVPWTVLAFSVGLQMGMLMSLVARSVKRQSQLRIMKR